MPHNEENTAKWEKLFEDLGLYEICLPKHKRGLEKFIKSQRLEAVREFKKLAIHRLKHYVGRLDSFHIIEGIIQGVFAEISSEENGSH